MKLSRVGIHNFKTHTPEKIFPQQHLLDWMRDTYSIAYPGNNIEELIEKYALKSNRIAYRGMNLSESFENSKGGFFEFEKSPTGPKTRERCQVFTQLTLDIFEKFYATNSAPDHMIHVSCTGYESPSAPQVFVNSADWRNTNITHAYHMGCYASIPAIRMAAGQVLLSQSLGKAAPRADIINTEFACLHYNMSRLSNAEQIIIFSLFGDGAANYSLTTTEHMIQGYEIIGIEEFIIPNSLASMRWIPDTHGFLMRLAPDVPERVAEYLPQFMQNLFEKYDLNPAKLLEEARFAIHPGGPKIIDYVQEQLKLNDDQVKESSAVLKARGNMSSATLPHIWELMAQSYVKDQYIVSLAFGPGLSIFGLILKSI